MKLVVKVATPDSLAALAGSCYQHRQSRQEGAAALGLVNTHVRQPPGAANAVPVGSPPCTIKPLMFLGNSSTEAPKSRATSQDCHHDTVAGMNLPKKSRAVPVKECAVVRARRCQGQEVLGIALHAKGGARPALNALDTMVTTCGRAQQQRHVLTSQFRGARVHASSIFMSPSVV